MTSFVTKCWNRRGNSQILYSADGIAVRLLQPDEILTVESSNERTIFAPYAEIIFEKDGSVSLTKRDKWVDPYDKRPWRIEIVNLEGKVLEQRLIAGEMVHLPRQIPLIRFVESTDELAEYEKVEIRQTKQRVRLEAIPGYYGFESIQKDFKTLRPQKDLERIKVDREQAEKPAPLDTPQEI